MGLIRLIFIGVVIWLCIRMVRKFQASQAEKSRTGGKISHDNMVPCEYCDVHVPQSSAIRHEQLWFCGEAHKSRYLAENR